MIDDYVVKRMNIQSEEKPKRYKRIETYTALFVLFIFLVLIGRYFRLSSLEGSLFSRVNNAIIKKENADYLIKDTLKKSQRNYSNYTLRFIDGKEWSLFVDGTNVSAMEYEVKNENGKISICSLQGSAINSLDVDIDGVRDYFSRSNCIVTDIPYVDGHQFLVQEQEDLFPIFGYHNVVEAENNLKDPYLEMRKSDFEGQVHFYNEELGCRWLTLGEIVSDFILKDRKIPRNVCAMNFDDGRKNNYEIVFPILKENNIHATFFIIFGRLGEKAYMTISEVSELFRSGNEIGSHTVNGGGLVNTSWFTGGPFTADELYKQISESKAISEEYSYNSKIFAYPLGEWNNAVVDAIKQAGYVAARDTQKDEGWRDRRALATSMSTDFLWHFNYYKPELRYNEEIRKEVGYNGWWQFEEGNLILNDLNSNARVLQGVAPMEQSYAVVSLVDPGDTNENMFLLENDGEYIVDVFAMNDASDGIGMATFIDDKEYRVLKDSAQGCLLYNGKSLYCHYVVKAGLLAGKHKLSVINKVGQTNLDRFRVFRSVSAKSEYRVHMKR